LNAPNGYPAKFRGAATYLELAGPKIRIQNYLSLRGIDQENVGENVPHADTDRGNLYFSSVDKKIHVIDEDGIDTVLGEPTDTGDITFDGIKIIGAGTASSDEAGNGTIELVPDNDLYDISPNVSPNTGYGSSGGQYLVIDPTVPGHIHIRAGGPIDEAAAQLILGGEKANVIVRDQDDGYDEKHYVTINTHAPGISTETYRWRFHDDGTIEFPHLNIDLLNGGLVGVEGLQFGRNSLASVITGAVPTIDTAASPIIVQGQSHASGSGKGGDIYLWGGKSTADGGDIDIKAGTSSTAGSVPGSVSITGGGHSAGTGGNVAITAGSGAGYMSSLSGEVSVSAGDYDWVFKNNGVTSFPLLNVNLQLGGVTAVEAIKFSNTIKKSVITGPTPASGDAATALIMQGQGSIGNAGGDVCLWAGNSTLDAGNVSIIAGTTTDAFGGSEAGSVILQGGGSSDSVAGDVLLRAGTGDVASLNGKVSIANGSNTWTFSNAGTTTFPTITTNLLGVSTSVEALMFGNNTKQSVITGPTPDASTAVKAIIVQGQDQTGAAGGDVYLWGGDSNAAGGNIEILAGDNDGTTGTAGIVTIKGGDGASGGSGGNVAITGGTGTVHGEVTITSGSNTWTFENDGNITIPTSKDIREPGGSTAISGGNRVKTYSSSSGAVIPVDESNIYSINTTSQATTLKLPNTTNTPIGYNLIVLDNIGNALSKNITVTADTAAGDSIISAPSGIAIDTNYGLLAFKHVGNKSWVILYGR
jgi:hypothetical protein